MQYIYSIFKISLFPIADFLYCFGSTQYLPWQIRIFDVFIIVINSSSLEFFIYTQSFSISAVNLVLHIFSFLKCRTNMLLHTNVAYDDLTNFQDFAEDRMRIPCEHIAQFSSCCLLGRAVLFTRNLNTV